MADQTRSELISALCLIVYVRKVHVRWWTNIFKKQLYESIEQGHIWSIINLITIFSNQLKDYVQKSRMTDALEKTFLCYKGNGEYQKLPQ